ncbi:MAG: zinc ribbon domain-containing protein [Acidimicrobiales bacterium]
MTLRGLARCDRCGAALMARRREGGRRTYACPPSTSGHFRPLPARAAGA